MNNCLINPFMTEFNDIRTFVVMSCTPKTEADPGGWGSGARAPVKTFKKRLTATLHCRFRKSSGSPLDKFLDPLLKDKTVF